MNFLDFIFDNIFIVAIIVIGLFNYLSSINKKKVQQEKKQSEQNTERPVETSTQRPSRPVETAPRRFESRLESMGQRVEEKLEEYASKLDVDTNPAQKTFEEQRQEQYERLKRNVKRDVSTQRKQLEKNQDHKANLESVPVTEDLPPIQSHHSSVKVGSIHLEDKLSARGLIDSVIMAEVLGPPRALNPYQNIAAKRKRK